MKKHIEEYSYSCIYTDTFGGELNYAWVRRYEFTAKSDLAAMRMAKKLCSINGLRGTTEDDRNGSFNFKPYRMNTMLILTYEGEV